MEDLQLLGDGRSDLSGWVKVEGDGERKEKQKRHLDRCRHDRLDDGL